jgi:DNA replication protein DnaC
MIIKEYENNKIKIHGIKVSNDEVDKSIQKPLMGSINPANFFCPIIGGPGSGKTNLLQNLLLKYYKGVFDEIHYFSGSLSTLNEKFLSKLHPDRIYHSLEELPDVIEELKDTEYKALIVIDDLVKDINNKEYKPVLTEMILNRRHIANGVSIMMISQKLNMIPLFLRAQASHIIYFNGRNKRENESLYNDYITDIDKDEFDEIIKYVFDEPYSFLYIDKANGKYYKRFNKLELED